MHSRHENRHVFEGGEWTCLCRKMPGVTSQLAPLLLLRFEEIIMRPSVDRYVTFAPYRVIRKRTHERGIVKWEFSVGRPFSPTAHMKRGTKK